MTTRRAVFILGTSATLVVMSLTNFAQGTVTLHVQSVTAGPSGTTIVLSSGTTITVPITDIATPAPGGRVSEQPPQAGALQPDKVIQAKCAKEWPTDFAVRAFCERQQRTAVTTLNARVMVSGDQVTIRKKCATDWPDDFAVRNYCEEQQLKALEELARRR